MKPSQLVRIKRRRKELRGGHSVKCWKMYEDHLSPNNRVCTCNKNNEVPKPVKRVRASH